MTQEIPITDETRYQHDKHRHDVICPFCGEQGFDLQGFPVVDDVEMSLKTCWNCGNQFATERPDNIEVPF